MASLFLVINIITIANKLSIAMNRIPDALNRINPLARFRKHRQHLLATKVANLCQAALFENAKSFTVAQDQLGVAVVLGELPRVLLPSGYGRSCRFPKSFPLSGLQELIESEGHYLEDSIGEEILSLLKGNQSLAYFAKKAGSDFRSAARTPVHTTEEFGQFYQSYSELCQRWLKCFVQLNTINARVRVLIDPERGETLEETKMKIRHFEFNKDVLYQKFLPHKLQT